MRFANGRYPIAHDQEQEPIDNPSQRLILQDDSLKMRKRPDYAYDTENGYARVWTWWYTPKDCTDMIKDVRAKGLAKGLLKMEILIAQEAYAESMDWFTRNGFERDEGRGSGDLLSFVRAL
jgi:hypothetical protein